MQLKRVLGGSLLLAAVLGTSACKREATGQVVAVVNGDEITLQELNAKIGELNLPDGADRKKIQQETLNRLVDIRLLVQAAKADKIDQSPDFLRRRDELERALMGQMLTDKLEKSIAVPTEAQVNKYISDHPYQFAQRTVFEVNQLQFPVPSDLKILKALEPLHTLDAVKAKLESLGMKVTQNTSAFDSARMPKGLLESLLKLPPNEPFVLPANGMVTVNVFQDKRLSPITGEQAHRIAVKGVHDDALRAALQQKIDSLRKSAKIEYQSGLGPTKS